MDLTELKCSKKIIAHTKISANDSKSTIISFPGCCIKEHLKSSFDSPLLTLLEAWRELCRAMLAWAPKREVFARRKKDTRKGVMFEKAKKQLSVITGPSQRGDESHTLTMDQCATVWNKQSLELKIHLGHTQKPSTKGYLQLGAKHTEVMNRRLTGMIYSSTNKAMPWRQREKREDGKRSRDVQITAMEESWKLPVLSRRFWY